MPPSAPDIALRRLVVELASLHPEDLTAVLEEFGPAERARVETLLRAYADGEDTIEVSAPAAPDFDRSKLSAWLIERLTDEASGMTAHAHAALRECTIRLYPAVSASERESAGFFQRLIGNPGRAP